MKSALIFSASLLVLTACSGTSDVSNRTPKGNPNAAVVIIEYADLQCPACRAAHQSIATPLVAQYGNQISYHFKHFPLRSIHRFALDAAEASECAADQGKFWEFVDIAYERQEELSLEALPAWAEVLNLDMAQFNKCRKSHARRDTVLADYKEGREFNVGGTPTFFINGKNVQTGYDTLTEAIDAELERLTQRL